MTLLGIGIEPKTTSIEHFIVKFTLTGGKVYLDLDLILKLIVVVKTNFLCITFVNTYTSFKRY